MTPRIENEARIDVVALLRTLRTDLSYDGNMAQWCPALDAAIAQLSASAVLGECIECGNDETGQPRILIHTTRDQLRNGPPLPFRNVRVTVVTP